MPKFRFLEMDGKIIEFLSTDRLILNGMLCEAKRNGNRKRRSCIVYVHGLEGTFYSNHLLKALSKHVVRAGVSLFSIETRGSYTLYALKKPRTKNKKKIYTASGGAVEKFEDCVKDIRGAINRMVALGYNEIILAGHSTGCQKTAYYQYKFKDPRVSGLIFMAPMEDRPGYIKILGKKFNQTVANARRLYKKNSRAMLPKDYGVGTMGARRFLSLTDTRFPESRMFCYDSNLKEFGSIRKPILAVFGGSDEYAVMTPALYAAKLQKAAEAKNVSISIISGATHSFSEREAKLSKTVTDWIASNGW
jgi:pimeloyl-ACP methyl ester carboxylesterase